MLTKPDVQDEEIVACLENEYGLPGIQITFLPLGADFDTAAYRASAKNGTAYFVKLRRGDFEKIAVTLPKVLSEQGIRQIIPPLPTSTGGLWASLGVFRLILYPFVEGRDGYDAALSEHQWRALGVALRAVHSLQVPAALRRSIPQESYSPQWREAVRMFLERLEHDVFEEPVAAELGRFLRARREQTLHMVWRAEELAAALQAHALDLVVCHSDIHAGNVLLTAGDDLYIVDWDSPVLAPKERDLMFVGGGLFGRWYSADEEERAFYQGYGAVKLETNALAYYRYERIVQDIAAYCDLIFSSGEGGEDREQSLRYVQLNYQPGGTIEQAYRADRESGAMKH